MMAGRGFPGRPLFNAQTINFSKARMANHHRNHKRNRKWRASIQIPEENPSTHISKLPPIYHIFELLISLLHLNPINQYEPKHEPPKYTTGFV
jgi:hypothetical protein